MSSKVFSDFPKQLTDLVGTEHGVYALYKGQRLYYVGLAHNLRGRIKQHLRDKHAGKWDAFSVYLVRKADHIRELEAVIMRIAAPKGNKARGRIGKAKNLKRELDKDIKIEQDYRRRILLGSKKKVQKQTTAKQRPRSVARSRGIPSLAAFVTKTFRVRGSYKGKVFRATVNKNGTITYEGTIYNSPSVAARAARGRGFNGWNFWHYKDANGDWVPLSGLRD